LELFEGIGSFKDIQVVWLFDSDVHAFYGGNISMDWEIDGPSP
jgi:hypothetical protein